MESMALNSNSTELYLVSSYPKNAMEDLSRSYINRREYPCNLLFSGATKDQLEQYQQELKEHSSRLFGAPEEAKISLLELKLGKEGDGESCSRIF